MRSAPAVLRSVCHNDAAVPNALRHDSSITNYLHVVEFPMLCARIIGQQCLLKRGYEYARKGYILVLSLISMYDRYSYIRELISRLETLITHQGYFSCVVRHVRAVAVIAVSPS